MIALLRGRIAAQGEDHVVIDTGGEAGGVGYLVQCAGKTLHRLPPAGQRAELRIITQVREDSITLYGFLTPVEEQWFRILQGIQGAIAAQDARALTRAAGVGPKLAGRIVAELKDRVAKLPAALAIGGAATPTPAPAGGVVEDALAALQNLGYGRSEAFAVVARVQNELGVDATLEQLLAASLKGLAR